MRFFFPILLITVSLLPALAQQTQDGNRFEQNSEANSNGKTLSDAPNGNTTQPNLFRPLAQTLSIKHQEGRTYRLKGKLLDDGGSKLIFLGFILSDKPLREILATSDPSEFLVPMSSWEPDASVPLGRIGQEGIPLDGFMRFYADVQLEPGKLYYYWAFVANVAGNTSGSPKKLKTPSEGGHW